MKIRQTNTFILIILALIVLIRLTSIKANGPESVLDVLRTRSIQIVDLEDRVVARIQASPQGFPGLTLSLGNHEIANLWITESPSGKTHLIMNDPEGLSRLELFAAKDGTAGMNLGSKSIPLRPVLGQTETGVTYMRVQER